MSGVASRRLPSWIDAFESHSEGSSSPLLFRRWAAITCLAGALERKLWVRTLGSNLYPNLYVCFVAPPGVGKTVAITFAENLWRGLPDHHVAPTSVTKAALIDALNDASRKIIRPAEQPPYVEFNSLLVLVGELGLFLPAYDNEFMNALTALYDGHPYAERRRSKDLKLGIPHPQLNILAATTPSYLNAVMPEGAWDQGFISRTLLVYSGEQIRKPLFEESNFSEKDFADLLHDLKIIGNYYGKLNFSPDAATAISDWHVSGGHPQPEHPKLTHYLSRRTAHLLKICMAITVSRADFDYTISLADFETALKFLSELEEAMPDIFRSMTTGGDGATIEDTWYYVWSLYAKEKKPIAEGRIVAHLKSRTPSHSVMKIIEVMVKSDMLKPQQMTGGLVYIPAPKPIR